MLNLWFSLSSFVSLANIIAGIRLLWLVDEATAVTSTSRVLKLKSHIVLMKLSCCWQQVVHGYCRWGSWVSATEDGEEGEQDEEMVDALPQPPSARPKEEEESLIREAAIGKGMTWGLL